MKTSDSFGRGCCGGVVARRREQTLPVSASNGANQRTSDSRTASGSGLPSQPRAIARSSAGVLRRDVPAQRRGPGSVLSASRSRPMPSVARTSASTSSSVPPSKPRRAPSISKTAALSLLAVAVTTQAVAGLPSTALASGWPLLLERREDRLQLHRCGASLALLVQRAGRDGQLGQLEAAVGVEARARLRQRLVGERLQPQRRQVLLMRVDDER